MKSEFRSTTPQDMDAVSSFLQRIFEIEADAPLIEPRQMQWKCWDGRADWPGSRGYAIANNQALVSHGVVVPLDYVNGERRLKMVHLIDWAADAQSVGSGVVLLKKIAQMADAMVVRGGTAMTRAILPRLGFKPWGEVTGFVLPLRPMRRVAGLKPGIRTAAQFGRSLLWSLQAPAVKTLGWTSRPLKADEVDAMAIPWPRSRGGVGVFERSAESMRYFLRCPAAAMELHSVMHEGRERGYFLLSRVPGQTRLVDFYVDSEQREDWSAVVRLAVLHERKNGDAAELIARGSDVLTRQALLECGFHSRTQSTLQILMTRGVELPAAPVRFQMLDSDEAYLHDNRAVFVA